MNIITAKDNDGINPIKISRMNLYNRNKNNLVISQVNRKWIDPITQSVGLK